MSNMTVDFEGLTKRRVWPMKKWVDWKETPPLHLADSQGSMGITWAISKRFAKLNAWNASFSFCCLLCMVDTTPESDKLFTHHNPNKSKYHFIANQNFAPIIKNYAATTASEHSGLAIKPLLTNNSSMCNKPQKFREWSSNVHHCNCRWISGDKNRSHLCLRNQSMFIWHSCLSSRSCL